MSPLRLGRIAAVVVLTAACSIGPNELVVGDCVDIIGVGGSDASQRLVTVDCDTEDIAGIYRVVWIEEAADVDPVAVTELAMTCAGPTLLPDADMLATGDREVVCFEPLE